MDSPILSSGQSNSKFLTLSVLPPSTPINQDPPLFNELYLHPIPFEPNKPPDFIEPKRVIPVTIDEWSTQNKIVKPKPTTQNVKLTPKNPNTPKKVEKKQFIEIDLLYGDIDRMLVLLRFCYPQLNTVPEHELRDEIEKFLKHLTRNRD